MNSGSNTSRPNEFMDFLRNYKTSLIIIAATVLFMIVVGGAMRFLATQAVQSVNTKPDVKASFSNCKILDKRFIAKLHSTYIDTSCGMFRADTERDSMVEKGGVYDLEAIHVEGSSTQYLTNATLVSK